MADALERWANASFDELDGYRPTPVLEWHDGRLRAARLCFDVEEQDDLVGVPRDGAAAIAALFDAPRSALVELMVGINPVEELDFSLASVVDAIAARSRPSLRSLALIARQYDHPLQWDDTPLAELGDLSLLWQRLPNLERLILHAESLELGTIDLPSLKTLELRCTIAHDSERGELQALTSAHWPLLERVAIHVGDTQWGSDATVPDLALILERLPALRHLAILGFNAGEQLLAWLETAPLTKQLETLSLPGTLEEPDAYAAARRPAFRHCGLDAGPLLPRPAPRSAGAILPELLDMAAWRRRF